MSLWTVLVLVRSFVGFAEVLQSHLLLCSLCSFMRASAAVEDCTHTVDNVQVTVGIYKQPYNFCVIVEHSQVERCVVLLFQTQRKKTIRTFHLIWATKPSKFGLGGYWISKSFVMLYVILPIKRIYMGYLVSRITGHVELKKQSLTIYLILNTVHPNAQISSQSLFVNVECFKSQH